MTAAAVWWRGRGPADVFIALLVAMGVLAAFGMLRTVFIPHPLDPWESGMLVESVRSARGMPVYESPTTGHATHMYGALFTWLLGLLLRATGPSVVAFRLFSAAASVALIALLVRQATRLAPRSAWLTLGSVSLFLATDPELDRYLSRGHADPLAWLVATGGLLLLFRFERRPSVRDWLGGTLLLVVAPFLKQTTVILAVVPFVAAALAWRHATLRLLLATAAVPIAVAAALIATKWLAPMVFFYMVEAPRGFGIERHRLGSMSVAFFAALPLFWALAYLRLSNASGTGAIAGARARAEQWTLVCFAVAAPPCIFFVGKVGGYFQGWFPLLFAAVFYVVLQLDWVVSLLGDASRPPRQRTIACGVLCALTLATYPVLHRNLFRLRTHPEFASVVDAVRRLPPGAVSSPHDPLIAVLARDRFGRNLFFELDAAPAGGTFAAAIPLGVRRELDSARYIVQVGADSGMTDWYPNPLRTDTLRSLGFTPRERVGRFAIWERMRDSVR